MNADGSNPVRLFGAGIGVTSIDLSPDGSKIVFGVWTLGPAIVVWDFNTAQETVLVDGINEGGSDPAWSPDGNQIVFVHSSVDNAPSITIMDANGANRTVLFAPNPPAGFFRLDWQPVFVQS
jgi:dipeptidyl aminopeptidase/acylaminoacyl peptidase